MGRVVEQAMRAQLTGRHNLTLAGGNTANDHQTTVNSKSFKLIGSHIRSQTRYQIRSWIGYWIAENSIAPFSAYEGEAKYLITLYNKIAFPLMRQHLQKKKLSRVSTT